MIQHTIVTKQSLLNVLLDNLAAHLVELEEARAGRLIKMERELQDALDALSKGEDPGDKFLYPNIDSHEIEYETAIRMVEMNTETHIKLEAMQFSELVMDQWGWKRMFSMATQVYK